MKELKKQAPILWSRRFWGICVYIVLSYLQSKQWVGGAEMEHLTKLVAVATGVGVADSWMRKLGKKK